MTTTIDTDDGDPASRHYRLPSEVAEVMTDPDSLIYLVPWLRCSPALARHCRPCFRRFALAVACPMLRTARICATPSKLNRRVAPGCTTSVPTRTDSARQRQR
jgi:hypothetical protein